MAHLDKISGNIILSEEDKRIFKECSANMNQNGKIRTPTADRIIKWIMGDLKVKENIYE